MKTISKKIIAYICVVALLITSNVGMMQTSIMAEDTLEDITLNQAIGDYGTVDSYQYRSAWLGGATSDYKYMIITFTGDIAPLRIEGNFKEGYEADGVMYWMNQSQGTHFTLIGNPVLNSEKETTVIVDIAATGMNLDALQGMHMHYGPGTLNIIDVKLTTTIPENLIKDIALSGLVGTYGTDTSSAYAYKQAYVSGALESQRYLLISFIGNAKRCRLGFYNADGKIGTEMWVDSTQSSTPLTLVGDPVLSSETGTTVVVDLEASGINVEELTRIRVHSNGQPFEITDCTITATIPADLIEDIVLSKIVGVYGSEESVAYAYKEESFSGALASQKYLVISFIGNAKRCRLGFYDANGKTGAEKWVDSTQSSTPLTLVGDPVLSSETGATVVVDLEASGVVVDELVKIRAHSENQIFEITDFRLTATLPEIEEPTEEETTTPEPVVTTYDVSVDGEVVATVEEGATYTLGNAAMGYVCGDTAYKAGTEVTINADMVFTTIELSVTAAQGAGIRYDMVDEDGNTLGGIRFQSTIDAADAVLNAAAVKAGTLVTANDIYTELGDSELSLDSTYTKINIENNGWYNDQVGTFCGSVVKIVESNWIRDFIARSYVTITYTDGTTQTVYSNMTGVRSIKGVAQAVQAAGYVGIEDAYKATIDAFAAAK